MAPHPVKSLHPRKKKGPLEANAAFVGAQSKIRIMNKVLKKMRLGEKRGFEPITLFGLLITLLLHGGALVGILLYRQALEAAQKAPPPPSYVVAKLLRLGKPKNPRFLPDKIVPQPATRKEEGVDLSADANDAPSQKKKHPTEDAPISDKLRHSLNKADLLAEAQREVEGEGSPDGVAGGTATEASGGDPYITKIADLWNRTWSLPAIIPREEARKLYVLLVLRIEANGKIIFPLSFDRTSGNAHFDNSIIAAWQGINQIPVPPPDRFASILANGLRLRLNWKGLQ